MSSLPRTNIFIDNDDHHHQYSMDNRSSSSSSSSSTTTTTTNINNRFDQDGLILPKKLSIPSLESREKKEMHREILWKIKHGQTTDPKRDNEYHKVYQQYQQRQRNKEKLIESLSFERIKSSSLTGHNNHKTTNNNNNNHHQHGMISNPIGNNTTKRSDSLL
ncbi:hypothetical protein DERP_008955 [Dermatophagoides pteronyssinus]|uniref:Uncharacterized protein n=1 Tax=Dermatophagoides pteronyssinus TaxID=6956 RepID=A0ABQ8JGP5_DERPT|nr:hypothetical protein DERP_008955 [Dermatophagoides pteronyssinus]